MPTPLKRHFRDIEIKIVSQLGWKWEENKETGKSTNPLIKIIDEILNKKSREEEKDVQMDI